MARGKKTGGRKRGTPNKGNAEVKEKIAILFGGYSQEQMEADFMELRPLERLKLYATLAEFITPKQNRETVERQGESPPQVVLYLPENNR